jgi:hypothetical protein
MSVMPCPVLASYQRRLNLASHLLPQPAQAGLVGAQDDPGVGTAYKTIGGSIR